MRLFLVFVLTLISSPALAQQPIDRGVVTQYLENMSALYTADQVNYDDINRLLKKHVDEKATIIMRTKRNEEKERKTNFTTLQELLDFNAETKLETLESQARYRLHNISYDEELGISLVIYTFWHDSKIRNTFEDGQKAIMEHHMKANCQEQVRLVEGVLKVFGSECNVDVSYKKPYLEKE